MSRFDDEHEHPLGRPRDDSIDQRVFSACLELLLESGWDGMSLRQVAVRAGVSRTIVQLRWSSKAELVLHAILGQAPDLAPFTGTDRVGWIAWVVEGSHLLFARDEVQAALPGLLVALQNDPDLRASLWRHFSDPAIDLFTEGDESARNDARAILVMAAGAALFSTTIAAQDDTPALRSTMTTLLTLAAGLPPDPAE